jgi:hypothetical protein
VKKMAAKASTHQSDFSLSVFTVALEIIHSKDLAAIFMNHFRPELTGKTYLGKIQV